MVCLDTGKHSMASDFKVEVTPTGKSGSCPGDSTLASWSPSPSRPRFRFLRPQNSLLEGA